MNTRSWASVAVLVAVLAFWAVSLWTGFAQACKIIPYPKEFVLDAKPMTDPAAPPALSLVSVRVNHSEAFADCNAHLSLSLQLAPADGSPWPADVGVVLAVVRGTVAADLEIPSYPLQTSGGSLLFVNGDHPGPFAEFTLSATAVNRTGTTSAPIEIRVVDSREGGGGCAVARGRGTSGAMPLMVVFGLLTLARRRRPR